MSHIWTVAPVALVTLAAVAPPYRPRLVASVGFWLGYLVNEFPFFAFCWLVGSTLLALGNERLGSPAGLAVLALAVLTACGLALVMWRGLLAGPVVARALSRELGLDGLNGSSVGRAGYRRVPARAVLWPLPLRARDVQRVANVSYGPAGRRNRLDLYRHRSRPAGAPVLIHFHGGHFRMGGKSREARALFYRLARQGWVCISADYRVRRAGRFPASQVDAKRAIAWVRQHAGEYGADPSLLVVAGGSAGAHLASMAGADGERPCRSSPASRMPTRRSAPPSASTASTEPATSRGPCRHRRAPTFAPTRPRSSSRMATTTPSSPAASAESFVDALRSVSMNPVVYARLPGAQHSFDLLQSVRFQYVIDGIEAFAAWVRARRDPPSAQLTTASPPSRAIPH